MSKLFVAALLAFIAVGPKFNGCRDLTVSTTQLAYPKVRDMRTSVALPPQKVVTRAPDSLSVPVGGREVMLDRAAFEASLSNPVAADTASVGRGRRRFAKICTPCHGLQMKGDGPVIPKYIPPPDLLGPTTRARTDGFIYTYIRHGGAVMPSYGAQVTAAEAWDLINFIRDEQRRNPR